VEIIQIFIIEKNTSGIVRCRDTDKPDFSFNIANRSVLSFSTISRMPVSTTDGDFCGVLINSVPILCRTRSSFHSCIPVFVGLNPNVNSPAFSKQVASLLPCKAIVCQCPFLLTESTDSLDGPVRRHRIHVHPAVLLWLKSKGEEHEYYSSLNRTFSRNGPKACLVVQQSYGATGSCRIWLGGRGYFDFKLTSENKFGFRLQHIFILLFAIRRKWEQEPNTK
jgi:hypothetical protein